MEEFSWKYWIVAKLSPILTSLCWKQISAVVILKSTVPRTTLQIYGDSGYEQKWWYKTDGWWWWWSYIAVVLVFWNCSMGNRKKNGQSVKTWGIGDCIFLSSTISSLPSLNFFISSAFPIASSFLASLSPVYPPATLTILALVFRFPSYPSLISTTSENYDWIAWCQLGICKNLKGAPHSLFISFPPHNSSFHSASNLIASPFSSSFSSSS